MNNANNTNNGDRLSGATLGLGDYTKVSLD
jgi:hypothetical protein